MSDAAAIAREWLHERSLSLERTEDLAAMLEAHAAERTKALRAALAQLKDIGRDLYHSPYCGNFAEGDEECSCSYRAFQRLLDAPETAP